MFGLGNSEHSIQLAQGTLKSEEIKKLNKEAKNVAAKMADAEREVQHREEMIDRLTNEITTLQQDLTRSHEKLADYETNIQKLRCKLDQRTVEVRECSVLMDALSCTSLFVLSQ